MALAARWFRLALEVIPAREGVGAALAQELKALSLLAVADNVEAGLRDRRQQLEVLAEPEVVDVRARRERDAVELDHAPDAGARPPGRRTRSRFRRRTSRASCT